MVHALEIIHGLLHPHGRLVDIHPMADAPPVEVRIGTETVLAGWLREVDDYVEYAQADEAIVAAVSRGWYKLERREVFTYEYHADSIEALRQHLEENWQDAILDETVVRRAQDLMRNVEPDKEIILRAPVWIGRLRPLRQEEQSAVGGD